LSQSEISLEQTQRFSTRAKNAGVALLLFALSYAFRLPELVHADQINSDAAVVGLQAMHLAHGEVSPFLWGSSYQTSVDSFVAVPFFAPFGVGPLGLRMSALSLHVLLTFFVYWMLRRRLTAWQSFVLCLPLVFAPAAVHSYALSPPRQAALTLAFAAFFELHGAVPRYRTRLHFALGGAFAMLAPFADPYALLFVPLAILFGLLAAADKSPGFREWSIRAGAMLGGAIVGAIPLLLLWRHPASKHGVVTMSFDVFPRTYRLLVDQCLPWALSIRPYTTDGSLAWYPWRAPGVFRAVEWTGAVLVVAGMLSGLVLVFFRRIPWETRRLGLVGALSLPLTIGAFLSSLMVMDHFSMRYLVAIILMMPLALAPLASLFRAWTFALALAPYLVSSAVGGWVSYGASVRGPLVAPHPNPTDEEELEDFLAGQTIHHAAADYWVSYRLSFVWRERILVAPKNKVEDRYAPYRDELAKASPWAYLYDPLRSRESYDEMRSTLLAYDPATTEHKVRRYSVLVVHKVPPASLIEDK
jgi:hypothetical protein